MKSTKIADLDISIRCYQFLKHNGIDDIVDLTKLKEDDLITLKGFNKFTLKEIKSIMSEFELNFKLKIMITREIKIRIFAEYLYCIATDGVNEIQVIPSNIEKLVDSGFKLKLKSVYNLTKEEMLEIAEEMRYSRYFNEVFTNFKEDAFFVSSESRIKRTLDSAMISYVAITNDGLKGNWFKLSTSLGVQNLKAKGYDVGSPYSFVEYNNYIRRVSLEEIGLAVII